MPRVKVQQIRETLLVSIPKALLNEEPVLDIRKGDYLLATRTKDGLFYTPEGHEGSVWRLIPVE